MCVCMCFLIKSQTKYQNFISEADKNRTGLLEARPGACVSWFVLLLLISYHIIIICLVVLLSQANVKIRKTEPMPDLFLFIF